MDRPDLEQRLADLHEAGFSWSLSCCGGDRVEAEDVLQTTYLKVLDGRAVYGGRSSLKTWLFGVIRRTAQERRRRRALRGALRQRWIDPRPASQEPTAHADVRRSERARRVRALLGRLSSRQRRVLELVFVHECTVSEAAAVLGVSPGTARTHYHRGKREIARWIDKGELP